MFKLENVSFVVRDRLYRGKSNDYVVTVKKPALKHIIRHCLPGQESIKVGTDLRFDKSTFKITSASLSSAQLKQIEKSSKDKLISKVYVKFDEFFGTKEDRCDGYIKQSIFFEKLAIRCTTLALSPQCLNYLNEITKNNKLECSILEFKGLPNKNPQKYLSKQILEDLINLMRNRPIILSKDTMDSLCSYFKSHELITRIIDLNTVNKRKDSVFSLPPKNEGLTDTWVQALRN